jgi:hypothetical protein
MTHPVIKAQDATEAVEAVLAGLARAYADNPREVEQSLKEVADADGSRYFAIQGLLKLARQPKVHCFADTTEAYDATQCRADILDGDVLVVEAEGVVGFLDRAWPLALTAAHGEFHGLKVPAREHREGRYTASAERAEEIAAELGFELAAKPAHTA